MQKQNNHLAQGSVGKLLFKLALPAIVAQLVNLLYNLVDRIYIGHIPGTGDIALTGLGLCFPIIMIITAFSSLIGGGGAPRVAIAMGKGDNDGADRILGAGIWALAFLAILLTIVVEVFAAPLLTMFGASEATLPYALN